MTNTKPKIPRPDPHGVVLSWPEILELCRKKWEGARAK